MVKFTVNYEYQVWILWVARRRNINGDADEHLFTPVPVTRLDYC